MPSKQQCTRADSGPKLIPAPSGCGTYERLEFLGSGTFGSVFKVKQVSSGLLYVIKRIPLGANTPEEREEALREVQVLSCLRHPHIVPYVEYFFEEKCWDSTLCLVMAHCEGGDLKACIDERRLRKARFTEEEIWRHFVQLLLAMQYLHSKRILHRDIKVHNIFLSQGQLLLGDFGVAKTLEASHEMARTQVGTLTYLSPEILEGKPYSFKGDVWALGCVMHEMCELETPFKGTNPAQVIMNIVDGNIPKLTGDYSTELQDTIYLMLSKDVDSRPSSWQLMQNPNVMMQVQQYLNNLEKSSETQGVECSWRQCLPGEPKIDVLNTLVMQVCRAPSGGSEASSLGPSRNGGVAQAMGSWHRQPLHHAGGSGANAASRVCEQSWYRADAFASIASEISEDNSYVSWNEDDQDSVMVRNRPAQQVEEDAFLDDFGPGMCYSVAMTVDEDLSIYSNGQRSMSDDDDTPKHLESGAAARQVLMGCLKHFDDSKLQFRVTQLRERCISALGVSKFNDLHAYLKSHSALREEDDQAHLRNEVAGILDSNQMEYWPLMEELMFFQESLEMR